MLNALRVLNQRLLTMGPEVRVFIGGYMLVQGLARLISGNSAANINIFTAQAFGGFMMLFALALWLTVKPMRRCHWPGRWAAIGGVAVWLFAIVAAWPVGAWVSIAGAGFYVSALGNEVRLHEC
jgi:hypothetical protein